MVNYIINKRKEKMEKYKRVRGMHDILPDESKKWNLFEKEGRQISELFGFEEIKVPVVEEKGLFEKGVGEETDIISKEIYCFKDRKGRDIALRPEGTTPVVRAYIENQIYLKEKISRLYYYGPMFRYDRPQKNRYRQFYHFGVELFGGGNAYFDGEIINLLSSIFKKVNIENYYFSINSLGCLNCKLMYSEKLKNYFQNFKEQICDDCKVRLEKNPLRVLDCKNRNCKEISKNAPSVLDILCDNCKIHFEKVIEYLNDVNINFKIDKNLVRGLDYYTKTVFEAFVENGESAVAGGGRYDNLVQQLGGPDIPAVGFAIGIERIIPYIKQVKLEEPIYCIFIGEKAKLWGVKNLSILREYNIKIAFDFEDRDLSSHLKILNREKKKWCIIIGENEIQNNQIILKDMENGTQFLINEKDIVKEIKEKIKC